MYYLNPENIKRKEEEKEVLPSRKADTFALGLILLVMVNGGRYESETIGECFVSNEEQFNKALKKTVEFFKDLDGGKEFTDYLTGRILSSDKDKNPLTGDILQECKPVKDMAKQICEKQWFKNLLKERLSTAYEFGFLHKHEFDLFKELAGDADLSVEEKR